MYFKYFVLIQIALFYLVSRMDGIKYKTEIYDIAFKTNEFRNFNITRSLFFIILEPTFRPSANHKYLNSKLLNS